MKKSAIKIARSKKSVSENKEKKAKKKTEKIKKPKKLEEKKEEKNQIKKGTELEEEIKQAEDEQVEQEEFFEPVRPLPISNEISAPILERIIENEMPIQPIAEPEEMSRRETGERQERRVDYSPVSNQPNYGFQRNTRDEEERKYESEFIPPILSRKEILNESMRQELLHNQETSAWETRRTNDQQIDDIKFIEQEARLPFEEQQKKYKRHKLR